jgi:hypothetical protein
VALALLLLMAVSLYNSAMSKNIFEFPYMKEAKLLSTSSMDSEII